MFDDLQVLLWSITYILIIIAGFKSQKLKMISMPYIACALNFSWEIIAFNHNRGTVWGHYFWLFLDIVIVYINYKYLNNRCKKNQYLLLIAVCICSFYFIFKLKSGMLISSFIIDLEMAVIFLLSIKKISPHFKILIAITKFLGDVFAGIYYFEYSKIIAVIAVIVFICNSVYLFLCIKEYLLLGKNKYYNVNIEREKVSSNCGKLNKKRRKK